MTSPQPDRRDGQARAFLVERYLSAAAAEELAASTARIARLCADSGPTDSAVRYLFSAYLPTEEICFCLFQAPSADAVRALNRRARFALDRVTDAALVYYEQDRPRPRLTSPDPYPSPPERM
ncbi:MAG: DUF4242 domain-containing protein [Actinomycetota bacterium]|nr:DUF4242 domain-containing protein [Actinomycetota bacterium]